MSTSYWTRLVYGFKVKEETLKKKVKKYDENTGEPYEKEIDGGQVASINGVVVLSNYEDEMCEGETFMKTLEISSAGYCGQNGKFVGVDVGLVDLDDPISLPNLEAAKENKEIKVLSSMVGLEPKLFLLMYAG